MQIAQLDTAGAGTAGAVTGAARRWLRIEGLAALAAGVALYLAYGGQLIWLSDLRRLAL